MRNKITVTISDVHGAWHFSVHKVARKIALYVIASVVIAFVAIIGVIQFLNYEVVKLEDSNLNFSQKINGLNDQNSSLSAAISSQEDQLAIISEKLNNFELSIGLAPQQDSDMNKRIADITLAEKLMLLQNIPNGGPLAITRITGSFGMRTHPVTGKRAHHGGIDLRAKMNTPVYASADGLVEYAMFQKKSGYGKLLLIRHNYGFKTVYGHLNKFTVKYGDFVKKGDLVAYTGNSGLSNGPHLHYEVRHIYRSLNPINFISWNLDNYQSIFNREKKIKWLSLIQAVSQQTHLPSPPPLLHTAL